MPLEIVSYISLNFSDFFLVLVLVYLHQLSSWDYFNGYLALVLFGESWTLYASERPEYLSTLDLNSRHAHICACSLSFIFRICFYLFWPGKMSSTLYHALIDTFSMFPTRLPNDNELLLLVLRFYSNNYSEVSFWSGIGVYASHYFVLSFLLVPTVPHGNLCPKSQPSSTLDQYSMVIVKPVFLQRHCQITVGR